MNMMSFEVFDQLLNEMRRLAKGEPAQDPAMGAWAQKMLDIFRDIQTDAVVAKTRAAPPVAAPAKKAKKEVPRTTKETSAQRVERYVAELMA